MKIYRSSEKFPPQIPKPMVALGNFDGVHKAHQRMFRLLVREAQGQGGSSVVYTFEPHPVKVLAKKSAPLRINSLEQKLELIEACGIDITVVEKFDRGFAQMSAQNWFQKIISKRIRATDIFAGYDFTFGKQRSGTTETLQTLCDQNKMRCHILPAQLIQGILISSSQIRLFIQQGEIHQANRLLGRPFFVDGEVISGLGRGATLGIPTANLKTKNELLPNRGVYACWVSFDKNQYRAVTNLGVNPTFGGHTLSLETHLLNFNEKIYGKKLRLHFIKKIREETAFATPKELIKQIKNDISKAKKLLVS